MKQLYSLILLWACVSWLPAQAQNWRPFRPNGDVHTFRGASADTLLTLRLDSAAREGADSVYYFNRIVRKATSYSWRKSRNNVFGQRLRYIPAYRTYNLEWYEPGTFNTPTIAVIWVLKPFARVGDTWQSFNIDYSFSTKLLSRGTQVIDGVVDSVATFQFLPGETVVLSKNFGLVSAPANLGMWLSGDIRPGQLTQARRPAPAGQSFYDPTQLLDLQPGDELGYVGSPYRSSPIACQTTYLLRRVLTRVVTADSIRYTFRQQSRTVYSGAPGCSGSGVVFSPTITVRAAASRQTGEWAASFEPGLPRHVGLLTYAYKPGSWPNSLIMAHPLVPNRQGGTCGTTVPIVHEQLYGSGVFTPGIDALTWGQSAGSGVGVISQGDYSLTYFRRTVSGLPQVCGSRSNFELLLPNKEAHRVASFQLYPNPAGHAATLTLPAPAATGTTVRLLDVLGRAVGDHQVLTAGQTTATLTLQGVKPGLYLVEVQVPGQLPQHVRLQHE